MVQRRDTLSGGVVIGPPQRIEVPELGKLTVSRAWPRGTDHALLELTRDDVVGRVDTVNAEWFAEPEALATHSARVRGAVSLPSFGVLVHPRGKDRTLPVLQGLLERGVELVVHRPGRRAVLRRERDGVVEYIKLVRPGRVSPVLAAHQVVEAALAGVCAVPDIRAAQDDEGVAVLSALPGASLHDLARSPSADVVHLRDGWHTLGRAVASLAADDDGGVELSAHGPDREMETVQQWWEPVRAWGVLPAMAQIDLDDALAPLRTEAPTRYGLLHRDLHDKQVICAWDGEIGLLDLDTTARGEPALDLANLLAHLELRVHQGLLRREHARDARIALLDGAAPDEATAARLPAYLRAARLRLVAVYALRPRWRAAAEAMLRSVMT